MTKQRFTASALLASAFALGFSVQACGGAGPDGSAEGQSNVGHTSQDLTIGGIFKVPAPTVSVGIGDQTVTLDPVGAIDKGLNALLPDGTLSIDPFKPINQVTAGIFKVLETPVSIGLSGAGVEVGIKLPGLPLGDAPQLPDPGGIQIISSQ